MHDVTLSPIPPFVGGSPVKQWFVLLMVLVCSSLSAQSEVKLDAAEKRKLNTFFSNFSESGVESFKRGALSDQAMIDFALDHNYKNRFDKLKKSKDAMSVEITAAQVDTTCTKYFGRTPATHTAAVYRKPCADGEAYVFSQIDRLSKTPTGELFAEGSLYSTGSGNVVDPHGTPADWKKSSEAVDETDVFFATIAKIDGRYVLLEYDVRPIARNTHR